MMHWESRREFDDIQAHFDIIASESVGPIDGWSRSDFEDMRNRADTIAEHLEIIMRKLKALEPTE